MGGILRLNEGLMVIVGLAIVGLEIDLGVVKVKVVMKISFKVVKVSEL
jgi:hypothetical protein